MQIVSYSHNLVSGFCPCYPKKRKDSIFFMPSFLLIIYCNSVFNLPENPRIRKLAAISVSRNNATFQDARCISSTGKNTEAVSVSHIFYNSGLF